MASNSRTFYAKRNMWTGVINRVIILGLPFVIRTIIIHVLGTEYLGLSSLFSSILQVLNMTELGFSAAVVFSLYKPIAEKNTEEICALMLFYRNVYKIIGVIIFGLGSALMPFLPRLIHGSYPSDVNLYVLYLIYLVNTSISYFAFAYKNVLFSASQRQDVLNNINSIVSMVKFCIQIAVLILTKNYYNFLLCNVIATCIENLFVAWKTKKEFPEYLCKGRIKKEKKREITKQIKGLAIGQLTKVSRNSFDSIVLSMYCGLIEVAVYSNYYYVFNAVIGILGIITSSINAGIGNSIVVENKKKNYSDFRKFYFFFSWIGVFCTTCFFCMYQPFMNLWVGEKYTAPDFTMILFCCYFWIFQCCLLRSVYANAAGVWWETRWVQIGEMIGNLLLNFVLGYYWGMNGILLATIFTLGIFCVIGQTKVLFDVYFKHNFLEYVKDTVRYSVYAFLIAAATGKLVEFLEADNIFMLAVRLLAVSVISNALFVLISSPNQRQRTYFKKLYILLTARRSKA